MKTTLSRRQLSRFRRDGRLDVGGGWSICKGVVPPLAELHREGYAPETFSDWMAAWRFVRDFKEEGLTTG